MINHDSSNPTDKPKKTPTEAGTLRRMAALCSRSEHSRHDVWHRLMAVDLPMDARHRIIERLESEHYIDDERFARALVHDKTEFAQWGRHKIKMALARHGISADLAERCLDEIDRSENEARLRDLLARKNRTLSDGDAYTRRGKLLRYAASRGFSIDDAMRCMPEMDDE